MSIDSLLRESVQIKGKLVEEIHFSDRNAASRAPDFRKSGIAYDQSGFGEFQRQGPLVERGMPKFDDLDRTDTNNIYHFVRLSARTTRRTEFF